MGPSSVGAPSVGYFAPTELAIWGGEFYRYAAPTALRRLPWHSIPKTAQGACLVADLPGTVSLKQLCDLSDEGRESHQRLPSVAVVTHEFVVAKPTHGDGMGIR